MAAPLGFKTFTTGEVLTAADTNGYLMQGVLVFADAAARTAAITSPQEGQTSYLKDTDVIQVYSGSAWVTKSGGSPLTTKGDLYTYSTTDARLAVGANGTVLTADSAEATGMKWATSAAGGMTLISTTTLSGTSVTLSSIPSTYNKLYVVVSGAVFGTAADALQFRPNSLTTNYGTINRVDNGTAEIVSMANMAIMNRSTVQNTGGNNVFVLEIDNYTSASYFKAFRYWGYQEKGGSTPLAFTVSGGIRTTSAISSLVIQTETSYSFSAGQVLLYGVK